MYQLDEQKVKGMIKVRKGERIKVIQRRRIIQILKEEMDKESNLIKREDYQLLMNSIMGIEVLFMERKEIKVIYNLETGWRREFDGKVTDNNTLYKVLDSIFEENETPKRKGAL